MGGGVGDGSWSRSGLEGINTKMIKREISTWKWKLFLVTHSLLENIFHQLGTFGLGFPSFRVFSLIFTSYYTTIL